MSVSTTLERLLVRDVNGTLLIDAPWNRVEALHAHLEREGIDSTICLEPAAKQAHLQIWAGPDAALVQDALDRWQP